MPTPADQRLLELLDKWLKSLELHIRYSSLDRDSYWQVQPWPEHQRPSRWIIDLAMQKTVALKSLVQERIKAGDTRFSDALELMTFLANLIGSEHIERFIPMAEPENERDLEQQAAHPSETPPPDAATGTREMPKFALDQKADPQPPSTNAGATRELPKSAPDQRPDPQPPSTNASATRELPKSAPDQTPDPRLSSTSASATREMPKFAAKRRAPAPVGTQQLARTERRSGNAKPAPRTVLQQPAKIAAPDTTVRDTVIADAARLVQWGRKWYELAEIIAGMADRPPLPEVRRILNDNKTAIEKKAGG